MSLVIARLVRDVLVGAVWAGALTALALGSVVLGVLLTAAGLLQVIHLHQVRPGSLFGASSKPTTLRPSARPR